MTERAADPTPEALEAARAAIEAVQAQWLANHEGAPAGAEFYPVPIVNVLVRENIARALDSFAHAAVERERERCAKVCKARAVWAEDKIATDRDLWGNYANACDDCAEIILTGCWP